MNTAVRTYSNKQNAVAAARKSFGPESKVGERFNVAEVDGGRWTFVPVPVADRVTARSNGQNTDLSVKVAPAVAKGAYRNGREAKAKTGVGGKALAAAKQLNDRKTLDKLAAVSEPAKKAEKPARKAAAPKKAAAPAKDVFEFNGRTFRGKNAALMSLVTREGGALMSELLAATGWVRCRATLGKLVRSAGMVVVSEGKGDDKRCTVAKAGTAKAAPAEAAKKAARPQ